ncbi:MAG TPA: nucleotidyltransferase family protein [Burkholderiales bacterium]|nr:nucleotidyltransferase family protein [Burkholderiales bacterium]
MTLPPELQKLIVGPQNSIRDAMRVITDNWREIALVADDAGHVSGVVTDGDIRRGLLSGLTLDSPVSRVMTTNYIHVGTEADRASVLDLMKARRIRHVPVLDRERRLAGIHFLETLLGTGDKPNGAVVMAGGEGRRLRPLTDRLPKPMVPVAGRPILERIVLHLVGYGIKRIHISVNYMAGVITEYFGDGRRFGCSIEYLHEAEPLGTGGPLSLLRDRPQHPLVVMNGDLVTQLDISRLLRFHGEQRASATLAARHHQVEIPFGVVRERDHQLLELVEKPSPHYLINAGIYVLDPEVLCLVPAGRFFPMTSLFETLLLRKQRVAVYSIEEDWIDVGRREELDRARGENS